MPAARHILFVFTGLLGSCHLIGGTDGLVILESSDDGGPTVGSGGAVSSSTVGSTGGAATSCTDESCARNQTECNTCTCHDGVLCVCTPKPFGEACSIGYCDSDGTCVECLDDSNYPCANMSLNCEQKTCVAASCSDGEENGDETGLDCGGSCAPCGVGEGCDVNADCTSALCTGFQCAACNTHDECGVERYCENEACHPKKGLFQSCSAHYQCLSSNCVCFGGCACGF